MSRKPLKTDQIGRLESFKVWLITHYELYGIDDDEVYHYVELLMESIDRSIFNVKSGVGKRKKQDDKVSKRKTFLAIWARKYLELTDYEYKKQMSPANIKMIDSLIKELDEDVMTSTIYLDWFFDEFLLKNPKMCPPSVGLALSGDILGKFRYVYKAKIKESKKNKKDNLARIELINRARELKRKSDDDSIVELLQDFKDNKIGLSGLRIKISAKERKWEQSQKEE